MKNSLRLIAATASAITLSACSSPSAGDTELASHNERHHQHVTGLIGTSLLRQALLHLTVQTHAHRKLDVSGRNAARRIDSLLWRAPWTLRSVDA